VSTAAPGAGVAGTMPSRIGRLVVVGVGLIGGSFSLALKAAGAVGTVVGVGRRAATVERALALGVVDEVGALDAATFGRADLVLLAMPVGQMGPVMRAIAPLVGPHTIITDAGSTKQDVVALAAEHLAPVLSRFVPGHPIAGTEHSGPDAAFATLYRDRKVVLAPTGSTDAAAVALVRALWQACGARVFDMPAALHDKVFATVSHLPHLLAFSLVEQVVADDHAERLFSFAAGGFRDFTRIASSSPEMWRDICLANRDALGEELSRYRGILDRMQHFLDAADGAGLEEVFARAREARERWLKSS
jgi:prephenate dehydrogenase